MKELETIFVIARFNNEKHTVAYEPEKVKEFCKEVVKAMDILGIERSHYTIEFELTYNNYSHKPYYKVYLQNR